MQMDKTWSAQASRPYDPYLTPKGEEQVRTTGLSLPLFLVSLIPWKETAQKAQFVLVGYLLHACTRL